MGLHLNASKRYPQSIPVVSLDDGRPINKLIYLQLQGHPCHNNVSGDDIYLHANKIIFLECRNDALCEMLRNSNAKKKCPHKFVIEIG